MQTKLPLRFLVKQAWLLRSCNDKYFHNSTRWDDDVVFKNCAKGDDEKKKVLA